MFVKFIKFYMFINSYTLGLERTAQCRKVKNWNSYTWDYTQPMG